MGKRKRQEDAAAKTIEPQEEISRLGWRFIAAGALLVVLGFAVLTQADPLGRNWACALCPFLILGGYGLVGLGLFLPADAFSEAPYASEKNQAPA